MYLNEYLLYLAHFHGDRDYFECHEILEEYWKKEAFGNKQSVWVGLIQLAVSCYHHRRSNFSGAKKMLEKAINIFLKEEEDIRTLGLDNSELLSLAKKRLLLIEKKQPYQSFNLPLNDPQLIQQCRLLCSKLGFICDADSNSDNRIIVHRHKLRDRTNIIHAREQAKKIRKGSEED